MLVRSRRARRFRSAQRWCVKQHIVQVHRKLRLYVCPHCQHRTASRANLNVHIRRAHLRDREIAGQRARYSAENAGELSALTNSRLLRMEYRVTMVV